MVKYTISDALKEGIALLNQYKIESKSLDARMLLCYVLGCDKLYLTVHRDECLTNSDLEKYKGFISRRCKGEPVSYITGTKEFMSLNFKVSPDVLIPRPDTEILVERVISELKGIKSPVIVDMCTGSGAIAVSLSKYIPDSLVTGLDISERAIETARLNANENAVNISLELHDVTTPYQADADAVVSNPPYIPTDDIAKLEVNVAGYEPALALDGGKDGLTFYRAIVDNISSSLKKGGLLAFEVGAGLSDDVAAIMEEKFHSITVEKDLAGIERVVYGYLK